MSSNTMTKPTPRVLPGQRRAGAHEGAPAAGAVEVELLAPLLAPGGEAHRERGHELPEPLVARGQLRERAAGGGGKVRAEDRAGRLVRRAHGHRAIDREHAGRQARQDDGEARALALHRLLAVRGLGARAPQPLGHVVEGVHQEAHLVARGQRQARGEVALAHRARALDQVLHRAHQALRGVDRQVDGRQHGQQHHQRQREAEAVLERLAHRGEVAVLVVGVLHGFGQRGELRRYRVDRDHEARLAARRAVRGSTAAVRIR